LQICFRVLFIRLGPVTRLEVLPVRAGVVVFTVVGLVAVLVVVVLLVGLVFRWIGVTAGWDNIREIVCPGPLQHSTIKRSPEQNSTV
jgi:hypothetical protein